MPGLHSTMRGYQMGGYTEAGMDGVVQPSEPAGVVHEGEFVVSAPAVRALGIDRLERMHNRGIRAAERRGDMPGLKSTMGYQGGGYVRPRHQTLPTFGLRPAPSPEVDWEEVRRTQHLLNLLAKSLGKKKGLSSSGTR